MIICDVIDPLPMELSLPVEHNFAVKPTCLITCQIENQFVARLSNDLKPAVVQNIVGFIVIEAERSETKY